MIMGWIYEGTPGDLCNCAALLSMSVEYGILRILLEITLGPSRTIRVSVVHEPNVLPYESGGMETCVN